MEGSVGMAIEVELRELNEGVYPGKIIEIKVGNRVNFREIITLPTAIIYYEIDFGNGVKLEQKKTYLVDWSKKLELMKIIKSLLPEKNLEKESVDLVELIGKPCSIQTVIDYSDQGEEYISIGMVRSINDFKLEFKED